MGHMYSIDIVCFLGDQAQQVQNVKALQLSVIISQLHYVENASQGDGVKLTRMKSVYATSAGDNGEIY